jgi:hypothetical protein
MISKQHAPAIAAAMIWRTAPAAARVLMPEPHEAALALVDALQKHIACIRKIYAELDRERQRERAARAAARKGKRA